MESCENTLKKTIELDSEVDAYSLHVDPGTLLEKMIKNGTSPPQGDAEHEKQLHIKAHKILTDAGYKAVGHDRYSRVEWHMRENCLNGWPWGGILTTGAGCFMGYLQKFSYSNIENINEYMETVAVGKLPIHRLAESTTEDMMRITMTRLYLLLPVSKKEFMEKFELHQKRSFRSNLKNSKNQGLIEIDEQENSLDKKRRTLERQHSLGICPQKFLIFFNSLFNL